jgi:hypothetical protein
MDCCQGSTFRATQKKRSANRTKSPKNQIIKASDVAEPVADQTLGLPAMSKKEEVHTLAPGVRPNLVGVNDADQYASNEFSFALLSTHQVVRESLQSEDPRTCRRPRSSLPLLSAT